MSNQKEKFVAVNLSVNAGMKARATELGINLSEVFRNALVDAMIVAERRVAELEKARMETDAIRRARMKEDERFNIQMDWRDRMPKYDGDMWALPEKKNEGDV